MSAGSAIALGVAVIILAYLLYTLLRPEQF